MTAAFAVCSPVSTLFGSTAQLWLVGNNKHAKKIEIIGSGFFIL